MIQLHRDTCLLRRNVFKSQHPIRSFIRHGSSRNREPYILPRLAIDLDAHDNAMVRPATEEDYAVRPKPPRRQPYERPWRDEKQEKGLQLKRAPLFTLDLQKLTAPDLLAYALLGNPNASSSQKSEHLALRMQFKRGKIHPLDNADTKIKRLTYDFTTDASKVLEGAGFTRERKELIVKEIRDSASFQKFKRIVTMLSSTTEGCLFLAQNGNALPDGIRNCWKHQNLGSNRISVSAVLGVLNNLILNMRSKGVEAGPDLCSLGLYYASKRYNFPSIRRYLRLLHDQSYPPRLRELAAIRAFAISYNYASRIRTSGTQRLIQEQRTREALSLLTGWDAQGIPSPAEERQLSFASHVASRMKGKYLYSRPIMNADYVMALGYIGASDAIWHEWDNGPEHKFLEQVSDNDADIRGRYLPGAASLIREKVECFALAFLMAEDRNRALDVLKTWYKYNDKCDQHVWVLRLREKKDPPVTDHNTGGILKTPKEDSDRFDPATLPSHRTVEVDYKAEDAKDPLKTISPTKDTPELESPVNPSQGFIQLSSKTSGRIIEYYKSNNITPRARLRELVNARFAADKPEMIVQAMSSLLVPAWLKYKQSTAPPKDVSAHYDVDWVERDGVEGLAVFKSDEIVHFKPSGASPLDH